MDTDFILKQVEHMKPSSFSEREKQRYQAEKMLMRQFMVMEQQYQVPMYLSTEDMKAWLLGGRSFLEEFQEIAQRAEARKLFMAELAWTSARHLCLNQMEQELQEELEKEERLSLQFRRKVTVEGLHMFLSVIRPKAERDVYTFLRSLSDKVLSAFMSSHTNKRSKIALVKKLQRVTTPLRTQVVDIALKFLLDEPETLVEVEPSQTQSSVESQDLSLTSALRNKTKAASTEIGKLLAEAAATCFCLNTSATQAHLLCICTSVARDTVKAIYKRFIDRSKTFHLMDFDESSIIAREGVTCAIQDMDGTVRSAAYRWARDHLFTDDYTQIPEVCCMVAKEWIGQLRRRPETRNEECRPSSVI